jgi:flagellar assembly protein FliH
MSARLIKGGEAAPAFAKFVIGGAGSGPAPSPAPVNVFAPAPAAPARPAPQAPAAPAEDPNGVLAAARAEAERIVADARAQAARIEREAAQRGQAEARAAAEAETAMALAPIRDQLAESIEMVAGLYGVVAERAEADLVRLAIEIAKKIVQREITVDPEIALTLTRVALRRLHNCAVASVHLHPDDYAYISSRMDQLGNTSVELVEDRSVGRGGCLVRTEMGDIDARIEQQFAEVERGLFGVHRG